MKKSLLIHRQIKRMKRFARILLTLSFLLEGGIIAAQERGFAVGVELRGGVGLESGSRYAAEVDLIGGWHLNEHVCLGAGVGYQHSRALLYKGLLGGVPYETIYVDCNGIRLFMRGMSRFTDGKAAMFTYSDVGWSFNVSGKGSPYNGLFFEPGLGYDIRLSSRGAIYVMLGYLSQHTNYSQYSVAQDGTSFPDNVGMSEHTGQLTLHVGYRF